MPGQNHCNLNHDESSASCKLSLVHTLTFSCVAAHQQQSQKVKEMGYMQMVDRVENTQVTPRHLRERRAETLRKRDSLRCQLHGHQV